jgi:cyclic-di-AMP phosphodiesterase PgpH
MRKFFIYLSNSHENILKAFIVLVTVWLIAVMLPHQPRYKFDIKKGKIWNHEDLFAPFDFAIYKNPDSLNAERQRVAGSVLPHFKEDTTALFTSLSQLQKQIESDSLNPAIQASLVTTGGQILHQVYEHGVIQDTGELPAGRYDKLIRVTGNRTSVRRFSDLISLHEVENAIELLLAGKQGEEKNQLTKYLTTLVVANLSYDSQLTNRIVEEQQSKISATRGMIRKGDLIISEGQQVTEERYMILESLRRATQSQLPDSGMVKEVFISQVAVILISLSMLLLFLAYLRKDIFEDNRKLTLIFTLVLMVVGAYTGVIRLTNLNPYVVPLCILPVVIRVFFDTRLALFTHVTTVLILGSIAPNGYEFVYIQVIAGMVTIFGVTNLRKRAQLFISAGMILAAYLTSYLTLAVLHEGSLDDVELNNMLWLVGNVLLTLFAYPLIYVFEKIFRLTSDISLMELSDTNSPLLRELSIKAPGTFQHSMQVANLAEAATFRIGGNTLLVRVGALYHDIGKMDMPLYFIENQSTGVNPHDDLSFEESASIIISHVIRGIEKARKNQLPDLIIDFIRTHHGTTMVQYFYQSFLKNFPEKIVDEDDFRYPGPLPFSKETAVLMMADSVEAASRSLKQHNHDNINKLVDDIIDSQIENQQFINCDITFKDISVIKKIFKKMLTSMYHVRVEYPSG